MNSAMVVLLLLSHGDHRRATMSFVRPVSSRHDRATDVADRMTDDADPVPLTPDPLQSALQRLRLAGAIFLRAEYREPWAYQSLPGPETAHILRPGSDRVILFHVVAAGTCWVTVGDGDKHWAGPGDVIVLPYGDQHRMGSVGDTEPVPLTAIMEPPPWQRMPVIRHGHDGSRTDVVCGFLHSTDPLFDPRLRVFPPVFVVRPPDGPGADWVRANIAYALEQEERSPLGPDAVSTRLPELLLIEVLRVHLASAPAVDRGWVAALHDPVLNPALAVLHAAPAQRWTVPELARAASVSRSQLDARFREVIGRSPIRYLSEWRMHLAEDLLATTDLGVAAVARRVGYDAEEAFSRAFKRTHDSAPTAWRARHRLRA
jgi:AraC-like DNA-binding protein